MYGTLSRSPPVYERLRASLCNLCSSIPDWLQHAVSVKDNLERLISTHPQSWDYSLDCAVPGLERARHSTE